MTGTPPEPSLEELADGLARARGTLADMVTRVTALRGQVRQVQRRLTEAGLFDLPAQVEALAATVAAIGEEGGGSGPAAPHWDGMDDAERAAAVAELTGWVDRVLRPGYVEQGPYLLADCWARHEAALRELSTVAAQWRHIYARPAREGRPPPRPGPLSAALEWHDRWLPGAMRRVTEATRNCNPIHGGAGYS